MSVLESFVAFAEALPQDRRREIDEILSDLMSSDIVDTGFTSEELADLDRRCAEEPTEWIDEKTFRARLRQLFG